MWNILVIGSLVYQMNEHLLYQNKGIITGRDLVVHGGPICPET
jgi:hypothetical protein